MFRLLHQIPEAQEILGGMSRSTLYEIIKDGEIAVVKVGRRTYIAGDELERYVRALTKGDEQPGELDDPGSAGPPAVPLAEAHTSRRKAYAAKVRGTELMAGGGR